MAETLSLPVEVTDKFSAPVRRLRNELSNVHPPKGTMQHAPQLTITADEQRRSSSLNGLRTCLLQSGSSYCCGCGYVRSVAVDSIIPVTIEGVEYPCEVARYD